MRSRVHSYTAPEHAAKCRGVTACVGGKGQGGALVGNGLAKVTSRFLFSFSFIFFGGYDVNVCLVHSHDITSINTHTLNGTYAITSITTRAHTCTHVVSGTLDMSGNLILQASTHTH
jgi:hypothetical protein